MEYNTQRPRLKINDYGRNIYKLIEYAKTVEDRDKRNRMAEAIVDIMSHNSTEPKDSEDYKRKFWVHLMILSNWELDVDIPYDISREESVEFTPRPLGYNQGKTRYRHYGAVMESMIKRVAEYPRGWSWLHQYRGMSARSWQTLYQRMKAFFSAMTSVLISSSFLSIEPKAPLHQAVSKLKTMLMKPRSLSL